MNTEISTRDQGMRRDRGTRQGPAGRKPQQHAAAQPPAAQPGGDRPGAAAVRAGQPVIRQPAVGADLRDEPGLVQAPARAARSDQAATRRVGRTRPALRPAGTGERAPASPLPGAHEASDGSHAAVASHVPRTRFILLLLGMLGGGLVCLLVINTTLAAASFRINSLQQDNVTLAQQEQTLQQQVTTEESPASLHKRALLLGMRTQPLMNFLNLRNGRVYRAPATLPGIPNVPGYAP